MMINRLFGVPARIVTGMIFFMALIQAPPVSSFETRRIRTETDSDVSKMLQSRLGAFQQKYGFPGATAACVLPDGKIAAAATGVADKETGDAMTVQSRMLSASIGKTFAAAAAAALAHEGSLDLDVPVSRWLKDRPWFDRLPNTDRITMRHLLTHRSGLPNHVRSNRFAAELSRRWREKDNPFPPEALIGFILDTPPLFKPGKGWAYTDTGYILAGLVIEAAIESSYYTEIRERFLKPLGLTRTTPSDRRFLPGLAAGYTSPENPFGFPRKTTSDKNVLAWHPGIEWTGGGLASSSRDLARWGAALFKGNVVSKECLKDLLDTYPVSPDTPDIRYGAGVAVYENGPFGPVYGHGGWIPGYCSSLRYYPDHGIAIAFQINTDIGVMDESIHAIPDMEKGLAQTVISGCKNGAHSRSVLN